MQGRAAAAWVIACSLLALQSSAREEEDPERNRLQLSADLRVRASASSTDKRDGTDDDETDLSLRFRGGLSYTFNDQVSAKARFAGRAFDDDNDWEIDFYTSLPGGSVDRGQGTLDELYVKWSPTARMDFYVGRFQTAFQLRGVFPKSLDRKDGNNMRINWTDGGHFYYRAKGGWSTHLILQRNLSGGSTTVRRAPLDFSDDDSRITYFVNLRNDRRWGPVVQRSIDFSYLPASLLKDGDPTGRVEDYWGFVGRWSLEWHPWESTRSIMVGFEAGYAPETPTEAAVDLGAGDNTGGAAFQVQASLMNFKPGHSIGINLGRVEPGWLLSPQFRPNEKLAEVRYRWLRKGGGSLEIRYRFRTEIDPLTTAMRKRDDTDAFVRFTRFF